MGQDATKEYRVFALALVVGVVAALSGLIAWQLARDADHAADRTLSTLALTQQLVEAQEDRDLSTRGELIAGNQAVVAYMTQALGSALPGASVDTSSIVDLLEERRTQLGLDLAAVIDADGKLLVATDPQVGGRDFARDPVFVEARRTQAIRSGLWVEGERLLHVAMLPLARYGSGDAYLLVGEAVEEDFVQTIAGIGAADVAILTRTAAGVPRIAASTLEASDDAVLLEALRLQRGDAGARFELTLPGRHAEAQSAPLFGNKEVRVVALAQGQPLSASLASHLPTMLFATVVVLALVAGLAWHWRNVAAPLLALERLMTRAADTGDSHLQLAESGSPAIVRVAAAFNKLMADRQVRRD